MSQLTSEFSRNSVRGSWSWSQARFRFGNTWNGNSEVDLAESGKPWTAGRGSGSGTMVTSEDKLEQFERGDGGFQGWRGRKCGDPFELSGWRDEEKVRSGQRPAMGTHSYVKLLMLFLHLIHGNGVVSCERNDQDSKLWVEQ